MDNLPRLEIGFGRPRIADPRLTPRAHIITLASVPLSEEEQEAAAVLIACMREGKEFCYFRPFGDTPFRVEHFWHEDPLAAWTAATKEGS